MNGLSHHYPMFDPRAAGAASSSGDDVHRAAEELRRRRDALAAASRAIPTGAMSLPPTGVLDRRAAAAAAAALAHREEELLRLRDAHARIVEAELAARAMRDRIIAARQEMERANIGDDRAAMDVSREAHKADLAGEARQVAAAREAEQEQDAGEPASAASAHIIESMERLVALQDQQRAAARQREMERIRQAELLGGQAFGLGAAAGLRNIPAAALTLAERERYERYMAYGPSAQLAEEMALRERIMQRRVLEEEVLKRQQQKEQEAIKRRQEEEAIKNQQEEAIKRQQEEVIKRQQEEAIKKQREAFLKIQQQQQQQEAAHWSQLVRGMGMDPIAVPPLEAEREHISCLLELQRMTNDDLVQRTAEVQKAHSTALHDNIGTKRDYGGAASAAAAALERRVLESLLARTVGLGGLHRFREGSTAASSSLSSSSRLDMIDQSYAQDATLSRGMRGAGDIARLQHVGVRAEDKLQVRGSSPAQQQADDTTYPPNADPQKPLRYFNNGIEVDMDGNSLPNQQLSKSPPQVGALASRGEILAMQQERSPPLAAVPASAAAARVGNQTMDSNIISKFLTVVVSRVPEIAPAVADLLPDGGDPTMLKRDFPNVVGATLAELRRIQERLYTTPYDPVAVDLHARATSCISAIEPYNVDLSTTGGFVHPAPDAMTGASPGAPGTMGRSRLPEPRLDPNSCRPLMPNSRPAAYFPAQELAMAQHNVVPRPAPMLGSTPPGMACPPGSIPPSAFVPIIAGADSEGRAMPSSASDWSKLESPAEEKAKHEKRWNAPKLVHKAVIKPAAAARKPTGPPIVPKLVHHALFGGAFDANAHPRPAEVTSGDNATLPKRKLSLSSVESSNNLPVSDDKEVCTGSPSAVSQEYPAAACNEKSRPAKKRHISDQSAAWSNDSVGENPEEVYSLARNMLYQNQCRAVEQNDGVDSASDDALLEMLFPRGKNEDAPRSVDDDGTKRTSIGTMAATNEATKSANRRRKGNPLPMRRSNQIIGEDSGHSVVTEESEDQGCIVDSNDAAYKKDDGHFGASSVLQGLMGNK
eukprot:CAMPEP_0181099562 /NCGR_PEP_ID=MMETSP1071-20121207/12726_1 /TAXON_ID=35127 /ORGANISM="Thalassiosira sp., Strain NH16" /LENGTH=1047 /DNA_ID=CAMNT_0023182233 /DNA_START=92 /DNA_END=3235 /DNA_ORIENTATION=-